MVTSDYYRPEFGAQVDRSFFLHHCQHFARAGWFVTIGGSRLRERLVTSKYTRVSRSGSCAERHSMSIRLAFLTFSKFGLLAVPLADQQLSTLHQDVGRKFAT